MEFWSGCDERFLSFVENGDDVTPAGRETGVEAVGSREKA